MKTTKRLFDRFSQCKRYDLKAIAKYCLAFYEDNKINQERKDSFFKSIKAPCDGWSLNEEFFLPNGIKTESKMLALKMWADILE
jgi:hypothetical protein